MKTTTTSKQQWTWTYWKPRITANKLEDVDKHKHGEHLMSNTRLEDDDENE
jgi:hypothetical protein